MKGDDFWLTRIRDNRVRGLLSELAEAINDCDDPDLLHLLKGSLRLGLANHAALKEDELRNANARRTRLPRVQKLHDPAGLLPPVRRAARRLG